MLWSNISMIVPNSLIMEDSLRKVQVEIAKLELVETKLPEDKILLAHYLDKEKRLEEALVRINEMPVKAPRSGPKGKSHLNHPPLFN